MSQTVFLSTVSSEFGMLRRRLANLTQRTEKCQVRHQDDFFHRGVKTLQKLVEEIQGSTIVVHLIGAAPGWCVPADQAIAFLVQHPQFAQRFPEVAAQRHLGELTDNEPTGRSRAPAGRVVEIFITFGKATAYEHRQVAPLQNYRSILRDTGLS